MSDHILQVKQAFLDPRMEDDASTAQAIGWLGFCLFCASTMDSPLYDYAISPRCGASLIKQAVGPILATLTSFKVRADQHQYQSHSCCQSRRHQLAVSPNHQCLGCSGQLRDPPFNGPPPVGLLFSKKS